MDRFVKIRDMLSQDFYSREDILNELDGLNLSIEDELNDEWSMGEDEGYEKGWDDGYEMGVNDTLPNEDEHEVPLRIREDQD